MIESLLQWGIFQKIIFNTLLVSIPEELYLVMFTLILVGEFEYWKEDECKKLINRWDYGRILIPTLTSALLSNILRYTGVNYDIASLITILTVFVIIVLTNDIFGDASAMKWTGKAFAFLMIACITVGVSEFIYVPFVVYGTGKPIQEINKDIWLNFVVSLPSRIIQYSILLYFVSRKRTLLKGKIIMHIVSNPVVLVITSAITLFDLLFYIVAYNLIVYEQVLINISHIMQIIIIIGITLFPILNISGLVWAVYYVKNKEMNDKKTASEKLENMLKDIKLYTNNENYDNIKWKLNEIGMGIEEIATNLYKETETVKKLKKNKGR